MRNTYIFAVLLCALAATCNAQDRVFDWTHANDETFQVDPAEYHTGRVYHPDDEGGNMHVDIDATASHRRHDLS